MSTHRQQSDSGHGPTEGRWQPVGRRRLPLQGRQHRRQAQRAFDHAETVLWREMARAVGELRPRYVLVENVANILALHDGAVWGEVLGDLAALGYDVVWDCLPAAAVGAPHLRDRVFAVATHADGGPVRQQAEPTAREQPSAVAGGARALLPTPRRHRGEPADEARRPRRRGSTCGRIAEVVVPGCCRRR
jgi:site-specific DNA-cytosine methylase